MQWFLFSIPSHVAVLNVKAVLLASATQNGLLQIIRLDKSKENPTLKSRITYPRRSYTLLQGSMNMLRYLFGKPDSYWSLLKTMENAMNANVEINDYSPVMLEELVGRNRVFQGE